ncbi:GNAT family N-acetyltransferase [Streptomyces sp. PA5.6]|uniref:GNAT family N-acetyltransferase n=1 Tax=Streptomyces sp. PA5.6 TaxID=3035651 RepID=UPI003904667C
MHEASLTQRHLWRSAREAIPVTRTVIVEAEQDGVSGYGEASCFMTDHYNSGLERMHADLRRTAPLLSTLDVCGPDGDADTVWRRLAAELPDSPFVLAALDSALHDLRARLLGVPLWKSLGLDPPRNLRSSYSIGLDTAEAMAGKLRERPGWCAYKVKLADPGDLGILRELRRQTDAPFLIDGNCGWDPDRLVPALPHLHDLDVRLIEQPYPRAAWDDARRLKEISPIPVIADESITSPDDLHACTGAFHGINVKPMKAGGLTPALAMLRAARERGLVTMLGCMPESAAGVSATAHLGGLVDHLDVDVVDLLAVDTGHGLSLDATGHVTLPDRPGSGYLPDATAHGWYVHHVPAERARVVRHQVRGCAPAMPSSTSAMAGSALAASGSVPVMPGSALAARGSAPATSGSVPTASGSALAAPGSVPAMPGSAPATAGSAPATAGSVPAAVPAMPVSAPAAAGSVPATAGSALVAPGSVPAMPGSVPATPSSTPATPSSTPATPSSTPATPGAGLPQHGHPQDDPPQDDHPATRHLAALVKGRAVGAVSLYAEDPPAGHDLPDLRPGRARRLHGMATLDEVRGTGAGSALLRTALTVAALDGAETVWGHVPDAALGFYRRHGFDVLGQPQPHPQPRPHSQPLDLPGAGPHHFVHRSTR